MKTASFHSLPDMPQQWAVEYEQRKHSRSTTAMRAVFKPSDAPLLPCQVVNISLGGAWLKMPDSRPDTGSEGRLHARLDQTDLYIIARVVRQTRQGVGVSFIDMGIETYEKLKLMVERLRQQQNDKPAH